MNSLIQLCKDLIIKIENEKDDDDLRIESPKYQYLQGQDDLLNVILDFINK